MDILGSPWWLWVWTGFCLVMTVERFLRRHRHTWGPWSKPYKVHFNARWDPIDRKWEPEGQGVGQERFCTSCNHRQDKLI